MSGPEPPGVVTFNVIHNDGVIKVRIEEGFATFLVDGINDVGVLVRALNKAATLGATRGTMFTQDVVNDRIAAKNVMRAGQKVTWLGGVFTRLGDGPDGPQFRIDWDELPTITE